MMNIWLIAFSATMATVNQRAIWWPIRNTKAAAGK